MANKIQYGIKNCHYATYTEENGVITYDPPVRIPGAVEITLEPRGELGEFYADDILYYSAGNNQGYDGTLSIATVPESFSIDCLGESKDETDAVLTENANQKGKPFAFLFEFDGDVRARRYVLYNCSANRSTLSSSTKTDTVEPQPAELTFVASARHTDYNVKSRTTTSTPAEVYDAWYTQVYEPNTDTPAPEPDPTPVAVTGVTVEPQTASIAVSGTQQLTTTVTPADATNKAVTYSTSDDTIATVDNNGLVTGIAEGTATITVTTVDGSFTDTCNITVE